MFPNKINGDGQIKESCLSLLFDASGEFLMVDINIRWPPTLTLMPVIFFYDVQNPDTRWKKYAAGTVGDGFEEGVGWMEGSGWFFLCHTPYIEEQH